MVCALTIMFGDLHEILNGNKPSNEVNWRTFWFGGFFGMVPWLVMWYEVVKFVTEYWDFLQSKELVPWYAWLFLIEYWLLFWCFPITLVYQSAQRGKYNNDLYK